jgi:hypothetical protein
VFGISTCRIEAGLIQAMEDATFRLDRAEKTSTEYPKQERMALVAAQTQWSQHKDLCAICSREPAC